MKKYIETKSNTKYGAFFDKGANAFVFKLKSQTAEDVTLCIFKYPIGAASVLEVEMEKKGDVFEAVIKRDKIPLKRKTFYYGYRVFGANFKKTPNYKAGTDIGFVSKLDKDGNRFNPNKLAYDPYSLEISHLHSDVSSDMTPFRSGDKNYLSDNAKIAPKSVFKIPKERKIIKAKPRSLTQEIIAEVHIKDLTQLSDVKHKGTYKGAIEAVKFIKETGVTMVEFLPLAEFDSNIGCKNHWGYMPLNYFAIKKGYASKMLPYRALEEFRKLINEFHKNNIKVCMDVVYNHTGEGRIYGDNEDAQLFSYALIDNKNYYKLAQNAHYTNHSGCGNDLNTYTSVTEDLIVESLSFWINQGVDAFRFDLAVALMDSSVSGYAFYDKEGGILQNLKEKLEKKGHKINLPNEEGDGINLIAEPWMCAGDNTYQLGNFPEYFAEWNDITRDTVRKISVYPKSVTPLNIREIIEGVPYKFKGEQRSVNYVSCHDGFTLFDLNTNSKPSSLSMDGNHWEICSNYNNNQKLQDNEIRKQVLLVMLSYGIPMVQFGDIFLHTKNGNNNSYNLDNEVNWINYKLDERKTNLSYFIKELIKFRKTKEIFSDVFYPDKIRYFYPNSAPVGEFDDSYWKNPNSNIICFKVQDKNNLYVAISKDENEIKLDLPENEKNKEWKLIIDTNGGYINLDGKKESVKSYMLEPFGACVFMEKGKKLWN